MIGMDYNDAGYASGGLVNGCDPIAGGGGNVDCVIPGASVPTLGHMLRISSADGFAAALDFIDNHAGPWTVALAAARDEANARQRAANMAAVENR